jgi:hypothetical protein
VIVKQETKRNKQKQIETKRDTTETKRSEKRHTRNETKPNKNQQSRNCQWRIEKHLTFTGIFGYGRKNNQDFISKSSPLSCFVCVA